MAVVADVAGGAERCTAGGLAWGIVSSPSRPDYNLDCLCSSARPSPWRRSSEVTFRDSRTRS